MKQSSRARGPSRTKSLSARHLGALAMAGVSVMALAAGARAETAAAPNAPATVEEIVVTALQRSENITRTPASISVITAGEMAEAGVKRADD